MKSRGLGVLVWALVHWETEGINMILRKGHLPSAQCVPSMAGLEDYQLIQCQPQGVRGSLCETGWGGVGGGGGHHLDFADEETELREAQVTQTPGIKAAHRVCPIPQSRASD